MYLRSIKSNVVVRQTPDLFLKVHWRQCHCCALRCWSLRERLSWYFCLAFSKYSLPCTCNKGPIDCCVASSEVIEHGTKNNASTKASKTSETCFLPSSNLDWNHMTTWRSLENLHPKEATAECWVKNCTIKTLFYTLIQFPWASKNGHVPVPNSAHIYKSHVTWIFLST